MATKVLPSDIRFPIPVFLVSVVLLALQVAIMRMLAYTQGHHLAYIVLSVALLGFGSGGSLLTLLGDRGPRAMEKIFAPALLLCAVSTAALPWLARPFLDGLEVDLLQQESGQGLRLLGLGAVLFPPFLWGAMALSITFSVAGGRIHTLVAANLFGSALGIAVAWIGLFCLQPEQLASPLALLVLFAALPNRPPRKSMALAAAVVLVSLLFGPELPRSPYQSLSYALQLPGVEHEGPFPHPLGRVDRVASPALRHAPDLSLRYTGPVPAPPHLFLEGETAGVLLDPGDPAADILRHTPQALPYAAGTPRRILFLTPGGTAAPLSAGDAERTLVEPHPLLAKEWADTLAPLPVTLVRQHPRVFLAGKNPEPYDLIVFPERGQFGGPSGLQTLGEDNLFTQEALRSAFRHLAPGGRMAFTVWLDHPLRHAPRLLDLVATSLRQEGHENPGGHVVVVRGWGSLGILVCPRPLSVVEQNPVETFCRENGFDLLWPPSGDEALHGNEDRELETWIAGLLGSDPAALRESYRFDIRAPTDDRPFFNQFLYPGDRAKDLGALSLSERGPVVLRALLALLVGAALLLILGPMVPLRKHQGNGSFPILVFSGLGAGFMTFEVALMQRLTLLWGHPVVSAMLVMASLLCGMGLGSLWSRRLSATPRKIIPLLLGIACMQFLLSFLLPRTVASLMGSAAWVRYGFGSACLLGMAIPMGLPFPLCLRLLATRSQRQIPWACGIDSSMAVLSGPAAALIAFHHGYASLTLLSGTAYVVAAVGVFASKRPAPTPG